jgi:hypothetical protein
MDPRQGKMAVDVARAAFDARQYVLEDEMRPPGIGAFVVGIFEQGDGRIGSAEDVIARIN